MNKEDLKKKNDSIQEFLYTVITDGLIQFYELDGGSFQKSDMLNPTAAAVVVQFVYNDRFNKAYVESICNQALIKKLGEQKKFPLKDFYNAIDTSIETNMDFSTNIKARILRDGYDHVTGDNNVFTTDKLSPYSIGYWTSVTDSYEFICDKTQVRYDISNQGLPPGLKNGVQLPPSLNFENMLIEVQAINKEFSNKYNSKIAEVYKKYQALYKKYTKHSLKDINTITKRFYVNVL